MYRIALYYLGFAQTFIQNTKMLSQFSLVDRFSWVDRVVCQTTNIVQISYLCCHDVVREKEYTTNSIMLE